eukprot:scaffold22556_cov65-Phaeocystis_antarctica.AAC.4
MGLLRSLNIPLLRHSELSQSHLTNTRAVHDTRWGPLHWGCLPFRGPCADRRHASHNRRRSVRDYLAAIALAAMS